MRTLVTIGLIGLIVVLTVHCVIATDYNNVLWAAKYNAQTLAGVNTYVEPDSVWNNLIGYSMQRITAFSWHVAPMMIFGYVPKTGSYTNITFEDTAYSAWSGWNRVNAVLLKNSEMALRYIEKGDIGQRGLVTKVGGVRYYYISQDATRYPALGAYPPNRSDSTGLWVFASLAINNRNYADTIYFREAFLPELVWGTLAQYYFRQGDLSVANFFQTISDQETADLHAILENRPKDVILIPKVLSR